MPAKRLTKHQYAVVIFGFITGFSLAGYLAINYLTSYSEAAPQVVLNQRYELAVLNTNELKRFDGTDPSLPIYLALEGLVYDVTAGRKFYAVGGPYHWLAGRDSTNDLHIAGGDIIKRKYPVIGRLEPLPTVN